VNWRHIALGVFVSALWGFNFVAARLALGHVAPLLLVALRFGVAAIPALFLPRPRVAWSRLILLATALFIGQFSFLFWGMHVGMPPGLASVLTQAQAVFTAVLAGVVLHERPTLRKAVGLAIATGGLVVIGATVGTGAVTAAGLALTLLAAFSWAVGNVLLRGIGRVDMLALIAWLSIVPPLPLFVLSIIVEGPDAFRAALSGNVWVTGAAILYIALAATIGGYAIWGHLLKLYPAGTVAPFALLVPPFGLLAAWAVTGEQFGPVRLSGILLVVAGLLVGTLPSIGRRRATRGPRMILRTGARL
jgi:O-acetylserine/cysteine efflux transporter